MSPSKGPVKNRLKVCGEKPGDPTDKSMIGFLESWTRTAFVAAIMMAVIPVITFAQTTDTRGENASTPTGGTPTPPVSDAAADAGRFYFVTGVVFDWSEETRFQDKNCASTSPAALYGCGNGLDGTPFGARGDFGTMTGFDLGFGYAMTPALRLEALMEYHPSFSFKGLSNFVQTTDRQDVSADLSSLHGVLAAYWDLTEVGLPRIGPLRPFIGGGGGLSLITIDETLMAFPKTTTVVPGGEHVNSAWMLAAGVAQSLGERVTLNVAWRYTDSGTVETGQAKGRVVWRDGSRDPLEFDLAKTRANLSNHGLRVSLRYVF